MASKLGGDQSVLETNPHLAHYVFKMLVTSVATTRAASGQHPLSVSSSGESDSDEEDNHHGEGGSEHLDPTSSADEDGRPRAPRSNTSSTGARTTGPTREEKEDIVRKIIDLLDNEQEEDIKDLLRGPMGDLGKVSADAHTWRRSLIVPEPAETDTPGRHHHGPGLPRLHASSQR